VTHSREGAETAINSAIVGLAAVHRSAALAQKVPHAHTHDTRHATHDTRHATRHELTRVR
jgi:hypothetical protein